MTISSAANAINPQNTDEYLDVPEQQAFLQAFDASLNTPDGTDLLRLAGGPGSGKSWTLSRAAEKASAAGWVVFLIGPTHQATGVLAAAVPTAFPFEPDPKAMLSAGEIMYCTAHRLGAWVQKSRSRGAAAGEVDPVPRDSWLGRAFRPSWDYPPEGVVVIADETSMYPTQMVRAIETTLNTLRRECGRVIFVAVGDPHQLTPVRGRNYEYYPGEGPESPSELVTRRDFTHFQLKTNVRARDPLLRNVVDTFLFHKNIPVPPNDKGAAYGWTEANDEFYGNWADLIDACGVGKCTALSYFRATVAAANDKLSLMIDDCPASSLGQGRMMRVQETYSPAGSTLAASSDLVWVLDAEETEDVLDLIMPPERGHAPAYDARVIDAVREVISTEVSLYGAFPVVSVKVTGVRAGIIRRRPVAVASEHGETASATQHRWLSLEGALSRLAFRQQHDATVRRGLAAIYYHLADQAKLKLEAPYAMTSHRAQGSTIPHVAVLADSVTGGRIVDHRIESARDASTYVMLSRASESLTIAWKPRLYLSANAAFSF